MTKQFISLLFIVIYSFIGIIAPTVQFSVGGQAGYVSFSIPAGGENEIPQQESKLCEVEEESEFCHRSSFLTHHLKYERTVTDLLGFAPVPGTCNPFGEIHTPPPKFI